MNVSKKVSKGVVGELLKEVDTTERIEKEAKISWDGTNFVVRIPQEVSNYLDIDEENRKNFRMRFIVEGKEKLSDTKIELIKNDKEEKNR